MMEPEKPLPLAKMSVAEDKSTDGTNYARLTCVLMLEGTERMRAAVKSHLQPTQPDLPSALRTNKQRFDKLKKNGHIQEVQLEVLYPRNQAVDEERIDMSLWYVLARNITVGCKRIRWSEPPQWNEIMWQHDIMRIKDMRNRLFHFNRPEIDTSTFDLMRSELEEALKRLGAHAEELNNYFYRDLDPEMTRLCAVKLREQVSEEMYQLSLIAAREKKQIWFLIGLVAILLVLIGIGVPILVVYLRPLPPCSKSLTRIVSDSGVLNYMPREGWGAAPTRRLDIEPIPILERPLGIAGIFHTALVQADCRVTADCCEVVRYLQKLHMDDRGWQDIAYNFLIANDGVVYEGRGASLQSAAAWRRNSEIISIALLGNFMCIPPNDPQLMALYVFLEHIQQFDPKTHTDHNPLLTKDYRMFGHCQLNLVTPEHNVTFYDAPGAALMHELMYWDHWRNDNLTQCTVNRDCLRAYRCCTPCNSTDRVQNIQAATGQTCSNT